MRVEIDGVRYAHLDPRHTILCDVRHLKSGRGRGKTSVTVNAVARMHFMRLSAWILRRCSFARQRYARHKGHGARTERGDFSCGCVPVAYVGDGQFH